MSVRSTCSLVGALAALLVSGGAAAQASPPVLPADPLVEQLVKESLDHRPELRAAEARVAAARERAPQAGSLPDPTLTVGLQNDGFTSIQIGKMETSYGQIAAAQTFPWPGKRGLRQDAAELEAAQTGKSVSRLKLQVEADVRRAYLDLVLARERLGLLDRLATLWTQAQQTARARYEAGEGTQSDILRAQLEQVRIAQRRRSLQAQERIALEQLNRLRGAALDAPLETTLHLADLPEPKVRAPDAAMEDALARSPELAAAGLDVNRAGKELELAHKDYLPDVTVGAGVMPRGGDFPPMWQASVSINLPIYAANKQRRAVLEREAASTDAQQSHDALEQVIRLRVQERQSALASLRDTLALYRQGLLVQSKATAESTLAQYGVGRVTFASVLEAIAGYIGDEDAFLQTIAEAQQLLIADFEVSLAPTRASSDTSMSSAVPGAAAETSAAPSSRTGNSPAEASPRGAGMGM